MTLTFETFLMVIDLGPDTFLSTQIGPQMYGSPEVFVTSITKSDPVNLPGLKAYRRSAGIALQGLMILETITIFTTFT